MSERPIPETAAVARIRKDAEIVKRMLELGDSRLMAQDGPCGGQLPDLSPNEWGMVYRACKRIAKAVLGGGAELPASPLRAGQGKLRRYGGRHGKASANSSLAATTSARKGHGSKATTPPPKPIR